MPRALTALAALVALTLLAAPVHAALEPLVFEGHPITDVEVDIKDAQGLTPLMRAAIANRADWILALRTLGAMLNEVDPKGSTALMYAAGLGNTAAVRALLDLGADFNYVDYEGYSALMRATLGHHVDAVRALLEEGASPASRSHQGQSAIAIARRLGQRDLIALFHSDDDTLIAGTGANPMRKSEMAVEPLYGADGDGGEPETPGDFVSAYLMALRTATGVKDLAPLLSERAKRSLSDGVVNQYVVQSTYDQAGFQRSAPSVVSGDEFVSAIIAMARAVNNQKAGDLLRIRRQEIVGSHGTVWYEIRHAKEAGVVEGRFQVVREGRFWKLDLPAGAGAIGQLPAVTYPPGAAWHGSLKGLPIPAGPVVGRLHGLPFKPDHIVLMGHVIQFEQNLGFATNKLQVVLAQTSLGQIAGKTIDIGPGSPQGSVAIDANAPRNAKSLWSYQDTFSGEGSGEYHMRLVGGRVVSGRMPLKIFLCLPDHEHSFVAGSATLALVAAPKAARATVSPPAKRKVLPAPVPAPKPAPLAPRPPNAAPAIAPPSLPRVTPTPWIPEDPPSPAPRR